MTKVYIKIMGGILQTVITDAREPIEVEVLDFDLVKNPEEDDKLEEKWRSVVKDCHYIY